jgi:hypothetical protein
MRSHWRIVCALIVLLAPPMARAEPAPFDLAGPQLTIRVTHAGVTLPISETPNLQVGDQLAIKADLPPGQSAHYLLVAAFLRGATNPPPKDWFHRAETWTKKGGEGLKLTVPPDAQQALVFLAPQTGGDFKTLVEAVRGRPGAFVRASQDLNEASLERSRLDTFLAAVRKINETDPDRLKAVSPLLARSLTIKLNPDCLQKASEQQASCLMQGQDALVLNDGHSNSIVQALTSGETAELVQELSVTPQARYGFYSPYIGAVMDMARIMDSMRTAQYQYIPALATAKDDRLSLSLNTPPSFHDPKSVLVAALPAIEPPQPPPLRPVDPKAAYCAAKPKLVLPVEGAPLAFSTAYAHDMVLRISMKSGKTIDAPVKADAEQGGFVADTAAINSGEAGESLEGFLHGEWGFAPFDGPRFRLQIARTQSWTLADGDQASLIVGRDDTVRLKAPDAVCVEGVTLKPADGEPKPVDWKFTQPGELSITVPLKDAQPGAVTLLVKQYGVAQPQAVPLEAFAQAGHFERFTYHAGDLAGVLKGARLDEVAKLTFRGIAFKPGNLTTVGGVDELALASDDPSSISKLKPGEAATAKVALKDGRTVDLKVKIEPPRPSVALIDKSIQAVQTGAVHLASKDEVPLGATLIFSIRAQEPARFTDGAKIEVGTQDQSATTTLTLTNGLFPEDSKVAVATLDTGKMFSPSTFGPLQFRFVNNEGASDWLPLASLVRVPKIRSLACPPQHDRPCELVGSDLFLIDSISNDPGLDHALKVPEGFTGSALPAPRPVEGRIYVRLRDDPSVANPVVIPTTGRQSAFGASRGAAKPSASSPEATVKPVSKPLN